MEGKVRHENQVVNREGLQPGGNIFNALIGLSSAGTLIQGACQTATEGQAL